MTLNALTSSKNWNTPSPLPKLSDKDWSGISLLGLVFIVMAVLQAIGFNSFSDWFTSAKIASANTNVWAVVLIVAELWAGLSFLKVRLPSAFRLFGTGLAVLVAGFWLIGNIHIIAGSLAVGNSGYFGKYLVQVPGWWSAIEATVLLYWTLYAVNKVKNNG